MKKVKIFFRRSAAFAIALSMVLSLTAVSSLTVWATDTNETNDILNGEDLSLNDVDVCESEGDADSITSDEDKDVFDEIDSLNETEDSDEAVEVNSEGTDTDANNAGEEETIQYFNYRYGDPELSGELIVGTDEDGNDIYVIYVNDLDEIISMAEDGMDLLVFFEESPFAEFTLDDLYTLAEEGVSLEEAEMLLSKSQEESGVAAKYVNYTYGCPLYNYRYFYGVDESGTDIFCMFAEDIEEIISMAEDGMDLSKFFKGTVFEKYDLDTLYDIRNAGITIEQSYILYTSNAALVPGSALEALDSFFSDNSVSK